MQCIRNTDFFWRPDSGTCWGKITLKKHLLQKNVRSRKNRTEPGKTGTCKKDLATENSDKKHM